MSLEMIQPDFQSLLALETIPRKKITFQRIRLLAVSSMICLPSLAVSSTAWFVRDLGIELRTFKETASPNMSQKVLGSLLPNESLGSLSYARHVHVATL